jgi:signal transduction histidine kinase
MPFITPIVIAWVLSSSVAIFAWHRRDVRGALPLATFMAAAAFWALGYGLELGSSTLPWILFWAKVEYIGIVSAPAAWLFFSLRYTQRDRWINRYMLPPLVCFPLATLLLVWTNEHHYLIWSTTGVGLQNGWPALDVTYGAWFWVHTVFSYLCLLLGAVVLVSALVRSPLLYRGQAGALLVSVAAPWLANALYVFDLSPWPGLDLTPFGFALTGLAIAWDLLRYRFLDLVPVARDTLIERMSDGVVVLDDQDRVVDLNSAARQVLCSPHQTIIGQAAVDIFGHWPNLVARYGNVREVAESVTVRNGEEQYVLDLRVSPLYDRRGRLTGRLIVWRNITAYSRASTALRNANHALQARVDELATLNRITQTVVGQSDLSAILAMVAEQMTSLLSAAGTAIVLLDEAGTALTFAADHDRDSAARNFVGITFPLHAVPFTAQVLVDQQSVVVMQPEINELLALFDAAPRTARYHCLLLVPLLMAGVAQGVIIVTSDQPERTFVAAEVRLAETVAGQLAGAIEHARLFDIAERARAAAEAASGAKSRFLAAMSHELRTPLNGILGYAQLLQRDEQLLPHHYEALRVIEQSGGHLLTLITHLLDLAKIEAGRAELYEEPVHLPTFLQGVAAMAELLAHSKALGFHFVLSSDAPNTVLADPQRLRQVLLNLLGNAVKFTDAGRVTLAVALAPAGLYADGPRLRFQIEDTGVGIADDDLVAIFQPFQQVGDKTRRTKGTGLGLAICVELLCLMGSELQLRSALGTGSRFWFDLAVHEIANDPISLGSMPRAEPHPQEIAALMDLAMVGDVRAIRQRTEQLRQSDPQLEPFVQEVQRLAKTFQIDALRDLLRAYDHPTNAVEGGSSNDVPSVHIDR